MADRSNWRVEPVPRGRYALLFLCTYLGWAVLYYGINHATAGRSVLQPLLPFEHQLPLVTVLYPLYALAYLQAFLPLWLANSREHFWRIVVAFLLASAIAFALFLVVPMAYPRPALEVRSFFDQLLAWEYATDGPRNTFPSLHVCFAFTLWFALRERSRAWSAALLASAAGISVATVLLKQHFVVDVLGGLALALLSWPLSAAALARLSR